MLITKIIDYRKKFPGENMVEKTDIKNCFTELQLIKDKALQEKVVSVWKLAADRGKWKRLEDIPFTLIFENSGLLIDHTKRITNLVWNVGNVRKENLNKDYLV